MKKTIITTILAFVALAGMAQTKAAKLDTMHLVILKADALLILQKEQMIYSLLQQSDKITSKDATEAENICGFIIGAIFRKWPEFIPKQPAK